MTSIRVDPYVKGWQDCAETLAAFYERRARDLSLLDRILSPSAAAIYRRAAKIARASAEEAVRHWSSARKARET